MANYRWHCRIVSKEYRLWTLPHRIHQHQWRDKLAVLFLLLLLYHFFLLFFWLSASVIELLVQWVSKSWIILLGYCALFILVPIYCSFPVHYNYCCAVCLCVVCVRVILCYNSVKLFMLVEWIAFLRLYVVVKPIFCVSFNRAISFE